jgi:hypothetical protein
MSQGQQWEPEPPRYGSPGRSGAVTTVAVLNFVLGGLGLLCAVIVFIRVVAQ